MPAPKVAILLPTYEPDPQLLRKAIDGVLAQTVDDWTLLIHDDGSKEDVHSIVESYLRDPRVTFVRSERRRGIGGNWNAAFAALPALPVAVAYLFQDDAWQPHYLSLACIAMERHPSAGLIALAHHYEMEPLHPLAHQYQAIERERYHVFAQEYAEGKGFLLRWLKQGLHPNLIGEPSFVVIRASILAACPWDTHMVQCLDVQGWVRMLQQTDIAFVADNAGTFLVHGGGASAAHQRAGRGMFDRLRILVRLTRSEDPAIRRSAWSCMLRELPKMTAKFFTRLRA